MKKFKRLLLILLSAVCVIMPALFCGCSSEAEYVGGSLDYKIDTYSYAYYLDGSFKVSLPSKGEYKVSYDIVYKLGSTTQTKSSYTTVTAKKREEQVIGFSTSIDRKESSATISQVNIANVTITKRYEENATEDYRYAIGFGTVSGVILIGAIVVFILDKTGVLKKRK